MKIDSRLEDWSDLSGIEWPTMLFGNGVSINVWQGFAYDRLFDQASLLTSSREVFEKMKTTNFEAVLEAVMHSRIVLEALGRRTSTVENLYADVRDGLFDAVRDVHVPHARIPISTLHAIGEAMDAYDAVFTTNYDLIPYWALMDTPRVRIADFLWSNNQFDPASVELFAGWTALYFLHGGIHLWQDDRTGSSGKWTSGGGSLLRLRTQFGRTATRRPLFVSEGSAAAKRRTIRRSDYLTFALDQLRAEARNTVIIGSALGRQDAHVVEALEAGDRRTIAFAVRPRTAAEKIIQFKAEMADKFGRHRLHFFDSTTHPLGDGALHVP